ncbi:MAG: flavohemoprotein [Actinomycetota bacterium]|nr:flavohemoprotein [Actinomycetota bacterium]
MSSGSGSGADQHLLALLRAIRLRQAAPDAAAAGVADTVEALREQGEAGHIALPPAEPHEALPPATPRPGLPSAQPHAGEEAGGPLRPRWASAAPARQAAGRAAPGEAGPGEGVPGEAGAGDDATGQAGAGEGATGRAGGPAPGRSFWDRRAGAGGSRGAMSSGGASTGRAAAPGHDVPGGWEASPDVPEHEPLLRPAEPPAADRGEPAGESGAAAGKALATPDAAGRFADVEAVGRPHRNQFTGLPVRRAPGAVTPVVWPGRLEGNELEGGARPEWASGGGHRVRDEGGFLHGEPQTESGTRTPAPRLPGFELPHVMPPMVSRTGATGDGMDPADDALLLQTQRLLSTSLTFAGGPAEVAGRLRAALLLAHPSLRTAVPGGAETQSAQLARALTWLVHHLDRPPILVEGTGRLGSALAACGVEPGHLQLVGAALAEAMRAGMAPGQWRQDFDLAWRSTWQHAYEWIAHGWARAGYEPPVWDATVVSHELRRPDLAVVRLRPSLPMPFRPGQYARIQVPGLPAIWRPYSLAGAPRRNDLVELHVRAKTTTGVSGTLVHRTHAGDPVRLGRAEGAMTLPADPGRDLLMIAGDTGVAPLKALLTEIADTGDPRSAVLFWGVRDLNELYDIDEIAAIAGAARRATVVPVVSEGDPGPYASGLVTDAVAAYGEWSGHEVYLAGPPLMLAATSAALQQLGVAPSRIHHDPPE